MLQHFRQTFTRATSELCLTIKISGVLEPHLWGSVICLQLLIVAFEALRLLLPLAGHIVHQCLDLYQLLLQHLHILHSWPLQLGGRGESHLNGNMNLPQTSYSKCSVGDINKMLLADLAPKTVFAESPLNITWRLEKIKVQPKHLNWNLSLMKILSHNI